MKPRLLFSLLLLLPLLPTPAPAAEPPPAKPNILVVLTDDVGWGDYPCYNPRSKIATPHIDRLAREGMRFTHAHSPAALCAPTRYSILTGNYPWRGRAPGGTWGFDVPSQILPGQKTVANLLKNAGYRTAMFGKQGFGGEHARHADGTPDFTRPMVEGPRSWGFDFSAIIPRGHQAQPLLFLVDELPECGADRILRGQPGRVGKAGAPAVDFDEPDWDHSAVARRLLAHVERFLDAHTAHNARTRTRAPFFMHFCTDGAHAPYVPAEAIAGRTLKGATKMTDHTDMVMETDLLLGALMAMLDTRKLLDDTLLCFTSDNGGLPHERSFGHDAVGGLRGKKSCVFEGGHRVPFLVRWPGNIPPGTVRHQPVGTHDIVPTALELAGVPIPADQCLDATSLVPVLLGRRDDSRPVRTHLLVDSSVGRDADDDAGFTDANVVLDVNGELQRPTPGKAKGKAKAKGKGAALAKARLMQLPSHGIAHALYEGNWKLIFNIQDQPAALYNLDIDPAESRNHIADPAQTERITRMTRVYRDIRTSKRSTPPTH